MRQQIADGDRVEAVIFAEVFDLHDIRYDVADSRRRDVGRLPHHEVGHRDHDIHRIRAHHERIDGHLGDVAGDHFAGRQIVRGCRRKTNGSGAVRRACERPHKGVRQRVVAGCWNAAAYHVVECRGQWIANRDRAGVGRRGCDLDAVLDLLAGIHARDIGTLDDGNVRRSSPRNRDIRIGRQISAGLHPCPIRQLSRRGRFRRRRHSYVEGTGTAGSDIAEIPPEYARSCR